MAVGIVAGGGGEEGGGEARECSKRLNNIASTSMLYGQPLHRCSYDNLTISSVNKLKKQWRFSPFFPSYIFFTFLSNLFCFRS